MTDKSLCAATAYVHGVQVIIFSSVLICPRLPIGSAAKLADGVQECVINIRSRKKSRKPRFPKGHIITPFSHSGR